MKRKRILLVGLFLFFCLPNLGLADCLELGNFTRFYVQEDGSINFYAGNVLLGIVELQDCAATSSSNISLLQGSVCDGDDILVDGQRCTTSSVTEGE